MPTQRCAARFGNCQPPQPRLYGPRERFHWFKRRSLARAYRTGKTIAVSQAVADDAAKTYHLARQQIQVIPNPVDVQSVRRAAQEPCSWNGPPTGALRIAVVGRFTEEKGHATALLALALAIQRQPAANMQLELIGDGPLRSELQSLAQSLGIAQRVHFRGFMKNPFACMAACELLCVPSTYEGLPNVALESMALGLPVLATRCSQSLVELLGNSAERGVIVPIGDATALADQFIDRSQRPADWLARARCAADWVQEHHSLETWLQRMATLFDRAIESTPRSVSRDGDT